VATIEGTGIKAPSKKSSRMAGEKKVASSFSGGSSGGNYVDAGDARGFVSIDQATNMLANPERYKMRPSEVRYLRESMPIDRVKAPTEKTNFFSPGGGAYDSRNNVETASADIQSLSVPGSESFANEVDQYERNMQKTTTSDQFGEKGTDERQQNVEDSYKIYRQFRYENDPGGYIEGQDYSKTPAKEKTIGERVADFTGNVVNTLTGTPSAVAQTKESGKGLFGGSVPEGTYSQFSPTSKPQYQVNREKNRPNQNTNVAEAGAGVKFGSVNLNAAKGVESPTATKTPSGDTSFSSYVRGGGIGQQRGDTGSGDTSFSSYVRGAGEGQERGNTRLAEARQIAKRNPNVSINKSTGKAEATNDSGRAKAQAMAVNRKLSGTKPKSAKDRAQDAAKARKKAGPNRKMSDGQQTRSQAGASARTAQGNRARVRNNAKKRAQAAAKARRARNNQSRRRGARGRGRRGGRR